MQKLDFSQPTKFTTDLRRRIERALEQFCEALAARLCTELKAVVELRVADCDQLTWAAAKAQLPADSIAVSVRGGVGGDADVAQRGASVDVAGA